MITAAIYCKVNNLKIKYIISTYAKIRTDMRENEGCKKSALFIVTITLAITNLYIPVDRDFACRSLGTDFD